MDRQNRIKKLLSDALEMEPADRVAFLDSAASDDDSISSEVQSLLEAHELAAGFLDDPTLIPADPFPHEQVGTMIGRYKLLRLLGEGGFGTVYLAAQSEPVRREVAIKIIKPGMDTRQVMARFQAERQTLAIMRHPGIATVFDAGTTENGRPYFVMEYVDGVPITDYCDEHALSVEDRLSLFIETCQAVQHAHAKGVIHRDLKPGNLLVAEQDGVAQPKIIDFGVAKAMHGNPADGSPTSDGPRVIGTPQYMSPEQAGGNCIDIDTRADVYSLGTVLYELLAGTLPFENPRTLSASARSRRRADAPPRRIADDLPAAGGLTRDEDPPRPSTRVSTLADRERVAARRCIDSRRLSSRLAGDLDWITLKALERDRERRYGSVLELAEDVRRHLRHEPVAARRPSTLYRLSKFVSRNRAAVVATIVVVAVFVAGFVMTSMSMLRAKRDAVKSQQIAAFMQDMLGGIDPSVARGKDTSLIRSVLEQTSRRIGAELANQPEVEASIRETIGRVSLSIGDYDAAIDHLQRAFDLRRNLLGENERLTLESLADVALTLSRQGKLDDALAKGRDAFDRRRRVLGDDDPATLSSMALLGNVLAMQGRSKEAESYCLDALKGRRSVLGDEDAETVKSINDVGALMLDEGRYAEAERYFRESLATCRRTLGDDHPQTLAVMSNLARALRGGGLNHKQDEAATLLRDAIGRYQRVLGPEHPDTLSCLTTMGGLLISQRRLVEAEACFRQVLATRSKTLGDDHPDTIVAINNLGLSLRQQGKNSEAEVLYAEALRRNRQTLGELHPNTLRSEHNMAVLLREEGKYAEAANHFRAALDGRCRTLGEQHPDTLVTTLSLAKLMLIDDPSVHDPMACTDMLIKAAGAGAAGAGAAGAAVGAVMDDPDYLATLAEAFFQTGERERAIATIEHALRSGRLVHDAADTGQREELENALARYRQ